MSYASGALVAAAAARGDHTPADMARRMELPYLTVYRWATGRHVPGPAGLAAIQRAYGLTADDLLSEDRAA
ncbi:helix-turn-helix domain-containing protein [Streptomyces orinoci]|uniref:Helix-turn-helix transcriptional regulator n=1 Tax=Streptomyces orinoci TaxID=67339 RepID=A0ABV3K1K6_STRON|nr:helix-turn-helix transcriptional regulator [Streptomyces orinoci]